MELKHGDQIHLLVKEENSDIKSDDEIGMTFEILNTGPEIQPTAPVMFGWSNYASAVKRAKVEEKVPEPEPETKTKQIEPASTNDNFI